MLPVAIARTATHSAGGCGGEDQVSRCDPSTMMAMAARLPPIAILGATAVGKTAVAVALARRLCRCELVSVDAMAVYRGLDIGTAKPSPAEREGLRWHLIDVVEPHEEFSVARFQRLARSALEAIAAQARRPILVGGTGLYHRSVIDELDLPGQYPELARALAGEAAQVGGTERLHQRLASLDPVAAARMEPRNTRRVVRALEVTIGSGRPFSSFGPGLCAYPPIATRLVGLRRPRGELDARIEARLDAQLAAGFVEEVAGLAKRPQGLSRTAAQALGYRELLEHVAGRVSLERARELTLNRTRTFARRQEAWFRRDPRIEWLDANDPELVDHLVARCERDA